MTPIPQVLAASDPAESSNQLAEAMIFTIRQPLLVLDKDLRVAKANPSFFRTFQVDSNDTVASLSMTWEIGSGAFLLCASS
jgi:hypothetical protein